MVKIAHIFLAFLALLGANAHSAFSQSDYGDFRVIDGQIIWQHVYETDLDSAEIVSKFEQLEYEESDYSVDYKEYGLTLLGAPFFLTRYINNFNVLVEIKSGRYRVTCTNFKNRDTTFSGGVSVSSTVNDRWNTLEFYFIRNDGTLRINSNAKISLSVLSQSLIDHFDQSKPELVTSDDW